MSAPSSGCGTIIIIGLGVAFGLFLFMLCG